MRRWTPETAKAHIKKVNDGKIPLGLTYWSAYDYLRNHIVKKLLPARTGVGKENEHG